MNKKWTIILLIIMILSVGLIIGLNRKNKENKVLNKNQEAVNINQNTGNEISNDYEEENMNNIIIEVNNNELIVELEDNSSGRALLEKLSNGDIVVDAHDYGNFEKVGNLGFNLPTNDKKITTTSGDLILYQGNQLSIYYDTNTWNFTKLGRVININEENLKEILGDGDITLILKIEK